MPVALAMEGALGIGLQTAKGVYAAPTTWLPLSADSGGGGERIGLHRNYVMLDAADGRAYQTSYYSAGEWAEGDITFALVPGSVSSVISWIQDRDSDGQGKWASVLVDCVNEVKKLTDVKVRRATVDFQKGQPVICRLDVCGLSMEAGTSPSPLMPTAAPYLFLETSVEIAHGGGPLAADVNCERIRLEIDNMVEDPSAGLRLGGGSAPAQLYNLSGIRCSGSFSRDFLDSACYGDFMAGQEVAMALTLSRGEVDVVLSLPRVLYQASDVGLPGSSSQRMVEEVAFTALGSVDGVTPPVTLV